MDEWLRLQQDHPHVAFNYKNFNGGVNTFGNGFHHLYHGEPYIGMPENWDINILRQYQTVITWNPRFYENYRAVINMKLVMGVLGCNAPGLFDDPVTWDRKIHGVCILNNMYGTGRLGDIYWLRNEVMQNLGGKLASHVWCTKRWGGACYQGAVDSPYHHSHPNQLRKISEYKFCLALESSYHSFWTSGFVTERILNCFRAGTIPIYMGAYDIERYVPTDLFIDFRKYWPSLNVNRDYDQLTRDLETFPKDKYEDMVGRAREWVKTCRLGSIPDLEGLLRSIE